MPTGNSDAGALTPAMDNEVTFLTGLDANGLIAPTSFWRWNSKSPAGYSDTNKVGKWGTADAGTAGGTLSYWFDPATSFTTAERDMFTACFSMWSAVANIQFVETPNQSAAQFTLTGKATNGSYNAHQTGQTLSRAQSAGSRNANVFTSAILTIDTIQRIPNDLNPGIYWYTLEHEIGHLIGLGHAGPYDGNLDTMTQQLGPNDCYSWTIMSYIHPSYRPAAYSGSYAPQVTDWQGECATSPMPLDIVAIQRIYGKPNSTPLDGGEVFGFHCNITGPIAPVFDFTKNAKPVVTLWDMGKGNTLDLSGFSSAETVNLNPGTFSSVAGLTNNLAIAFDTEINTLICGSGDSTVICNDNGDTVRGGAGNDTLKGGFNVDTAVVGGNRSTYTITQTSTGVFQVVGPDGTDTLSNIEYLRFDDQTMRLLPGSGSTVTWSADPSTYMGAIRDFDGNDLGGAASWKLIGTADVNGDGRAEHILFNKQIGRWAEVGTEADGQTYFSNCNWAGDTRVVGIYIDPLVANGTVVKDSATDSQRRFQNDLMIDNIKSVLGQADYDHNGLQEVYFSLTDGTAYLHAYMHADGNIQYANYQSKQQVIDYLTSNGISSSTWATWFPSGQSVMAAVTG